MIKSIIVVALLLIAWLSAGRRLTLLLDRAIGVRTKSLPVSPLLYEGGGFRIGGLALTFGATNNLPFPLRLDTDSAGIVVLAAGGRTFPLGPRTNPIDASGRPEIDFIPDKEDQLSLRTSGSLLSWPNPFEIRFMGGPPPRWKRYTYYRLIWKKRSGAELEMRWRYEQEFYSAKGWSESLMMWNSQTGLLSVDIKAPSTALEHVVMEYVGRTKGWYRNEYRIEERGGGVVAVIYLADEKSPHPGAGCSILLDIDPSSRRVTREVGYQ